MSIYPNNDACLMRMTLPEPYVPGPDDCTALPSQFTKAQAIGIICKALHVMGLPRTAIAAWRSIADQTEALAWGSPTDTPVNYRKAKDMARDHGVSDRHWRRIESQLEHASVLARDTSDNGFRGKICKGTVVFGLSMEPALRNFAYLQECANRPKLLELQRKQRLGQIRSMRHRLKKHHEFTPFSDEHRDQWDAIEEQYRPTRLSYASISELQTYFDALTGLEANMKYRDRTGDLELTDERHDCTPCPATAQQQISLNRAKMSAPADSHVRHQYNLKYKKQTLNASSSENRSNQEALRLNPSDAGLEQAKATLCDKQSCSDKVSSLSQCHDDTMTTAVSGGIQQSSADSPALSSLTGGYRLNVAAMASIMAYPLLIEDIRKHKFYTACAALDPKHIWERFRRYNLKRDKQILPLAALRAFIKGWIPDQQAPYLEQTSTTEQSLRGLCHPSLDSSARIPTSPEDAKKKQLDYYINLLNSDQYVPPSMISTQLANELYTTGKVAADVLRRRGL